VVVGVVVVSGVGVILPHALAVRGERGLEFFSPVLGDVTTTSA
jgi:hypothetical protein